MPTSQRGTTLAARLGLELVLLRRPGFRRRWTAPFGYPLLAAATIRALLRRRPRTVVVVAPPVVAPLVAVPVARLIGSRTAVDVHTGALLDRRWRWSVPLLAAIARMADVAVVTLGSLAASLRRRGVRTLVVPDPLPDLEPGVPAASPATPEPGAAGPSGAPTVVAICGWGDDEPLAELADAARGRPWRLLVTGRPRWQVAWPPNAETTGFLPPATYADLLRRADLVVVLTRRDETLLSGAWEAIALGRPLLVSATPALVATFGPRIASAEPTQDGIAAGIEAALADKDAASRRSVAARTRFRLENDAALAELAAVLDRPLRRTPPP